MIEPHPIRSSFEIVREAVASVPSTEYLRVEDVLSRYPELRKSHAAMVDLAYEEYCQAIDRGDTVDEEAFAARFPDIQESLFKLLDVHSFVIGNSLLSAVEPEIHWPTAGEVFLGFELIEEIGRGAFSRVFLARQLELGCREVVVKVSRKGASEASMLGLLDHPNIVPIHSITNDEVVMLSALCMPNLGRTTALDWIRTRFKSPIAERVKSPRHLRSVIEIGKGVCRGLQFAHDKQILHCDVKPTNILITHDGEPLLLDFNLSTDQSNEKHLVGGTLLYMAPEQLMRALGNQEATITPQTDVYCLAATLFQMATGHPPFSLDAEANPRLSVVIEAALEERQAFLRRNHALAEPLQATLRDALAFDPADRMKSAEELSHRLSDCERSLSERKHAWAWPVAVSSLVTVGIATSYFAANTPGDETSQPAPNREDAKPQTSPPTIAPTNLELAHQAEIESRFADAIPLYRQLLSPKNADDRPTPEVDRAASMHSLAFCLLMVNQYEEANFLLETLPPNDVPHETYSINRAAGFVLASFDVEGTVDERLLKKAGPALRYAISFHRNIAELHQAAAINAALRAKMAHGPEREFAVRDAIRHSELALKYGLSAQKVLAVGQFLPELNQSPALSTLLDANPAIIPDMQFAMPARSPVSGRFYMIRTPLH